MFLERVVDEQLIDANVTQKELENLIAYDEVQDMEQGDVDTSEWKIEDDLLNSIVMNNPKLFSECPFLHESLMLESEEQLSHEEKMEAEILYEREKKGLLYTSHLAPFEAPQTNFGMNAGLPQVVPTSYNAFPSYLQPALNRVSPMFPASTYAAPMNRMHYNNNQMPVTIQHLGTQRMPVSTNSVRAPFNFQMLPPARSSRLNLNGLKSS